MEVTLPEDLVVHLVQYLPARTLLKFRLVSKKFHKLCNKKVVRAMRAAIPRELLEHFPTQSLSGFSVTSILTPDLPRPDTLCLITTYHELGDFQPYILAGWEFESKRVIKGRLSHALYEFSSSEKIWGYNRLSIRVHSNYGLFSRTNILHCRFNGTRLILPRAVEMLDLDETGNGYVARVVDDTCVREYGTEEISDVLKMGYRTEPGDANDKHFDRISSYLSVHT
jgi:hypothetical protein